MNTNMQSAELDLLKNERSEICISIMMPTHSLSPGRRTDPPQMEKNIQEVKNYLLSNYDNNTVSSLIEDIDQLYEQIDFTHNTAGIGLFISKNVKKLERFFFPVKERFMVDNCFDIRDLLYESYFNVPYVVIMLSQKEARLFDGRLNFLTEITDGHFPNKNQAEYEYSRPAPGSSYVGDSVVREFEKDKSVTEEIRFKSFLRQTDELLRSYLNIDTPLIVTGDQKDLVWFRQVTMHEHNIACNIPGNYTTSTEDELGALTWKAMKLFRDNGKEKLISEFHEKMGTGLGIAGHEVEAIWKAVHEGKGYKLLVEKDHSLTGYLSGDDEYELYRNKPEQPYHFINNVVDRLIEKMIEKKGEVIITDNDMLRELHGMALVTRY